MKIVLQFRAPLDMQRYIYCEMARLGLSHENLVAAHLDYSDVFQTILEFEKPELEQETLTIARPVRETKTL